MKTTIKSCPSTMGQLGRKVLAENILNELSILQVEKVYPQLLPFNGKKIITASGFSNKFKIELYKEEPQNNFGFGYRVFLNFDTYNLKIQQDITLYTSLYSTGGGCVTYYNKPLYIARLDGDKLNIEHSLDTLIERYELKTVYNQESIEKVIAEIRDLKEQIDIKEGSINLFRDFI